MDLKKPDKADIIEAVLVVCVMVSLVLVLLPQPYTMVDFPGYNLHETEGKRVVEVSQPGLEVGEEKPVKVIIGESFALEGSMGRGIHSELRLAYDIPSGDIVSLSEEGIVTLTYPGYPGQTTETIELGVGETWSKTVYCWLGSVSTLEPVPGILLGTLLYETCEARNIGYVDEITILDESITFAGLRPVFIQFHDAEGGIRFFISPNLAIFALLLTWNTYRMRHQKEPPSPSNRTSLGTQPQ